MIAELITSFVTGAVVGWIINDARRIGQMNLDDIARNMREDFEREQFERQGEHHPDTRNTHGRGDATF